MRRILHYLVVALMGAAVLPAVAQAGPSGRSPLTGEFLDVVVTLDRPATPALSRRLASLGTGSWTARHIPVASLQLPAARLDALRRLAGVVAVYPDKQLSYYSDGPKLPPLPGQAPPGGFGAALPGPNLGVSG